MRPSFLAFISALIGTVLFFLVAIKAEFGGDNKAAWGMFFLSLGITLWFFIRDPWYNRP